jgi:hypothetical protein
MIASFEHGFIFIKTRETGGTASRPVPRGAAPARPALIEINELNETIEWKRASSRRSDPRGMAADILRGRA